MRGPPLGQGPTVLTVSARGGGLVILLSLVVESET